MAGDRETTGRTPGRWIRWLLGLAGLVGLALLPYVAAVDHPLLRDDRTLLSDNSWLETEAGPFNVLEHHYWHGTRHESSDLYRPLTVLSLGWNLGLFPGTVGLQTVNLGLHALAVVAVWGFLCCVVRSFELEPRATCMAWFGAALFAVHPLASEAVLFASGRSEMLAALFGLTAFTALNPARQDGGGVAARVVSSSLLFAMALGFKESAASWVPLLAVWWGTLRLAGRQGRVILRGLLGWVAALAGFLVLRASVVGWAPHPPPWIDNPLVLEDGPTRVANAVLLLVRYLGKMVFPASLSVEYGFDQIPVVPLLPWGLPAALAILGVWLAVLLLLHRLSPAASFLWAFVPAAFAVTANVAIPIGTNFAERLAYLPLVGVCGLAGWTMWRLPLSDRSRWIALALVLALASGATVLRTRDFRDKITFDEATAAASPRAVKALANLGRDRLRQRRPREAIALLERAVAIWPDYSGALSVLADAHLSLGDRRTAEYYRQRAREAYARWKDGEATPDRR